MSKTINTFIFMACVAISSLHAGVRTLPTQSSTIYDICFTASGSAIAVADEQNVKIFSFPEAQLLREFSDGHQAQIMSIALSPDSTLLVSGDRNGLIVVWEMESGKLLQSIQAHEGIVLSLDVSHDGKYLLSGGTDNKVQLYDVEQQEVTRQFSLHTNDVTVVKFHPGGQIFFSGSGDSRIISYSMDDLDNPRELARHNNWVRHLTISPDGNTLTSVGDDRKVKFWDISDIHNISSRGSSKILGGWNTSVDFFSDNSSFALSSINGKIRIQAPITRLTYNVRRPVHRILLWPTDDNTLVAVVATQGKGVMIIPGAEMRMK